MALRNIATPVNSTLISMNERFSGLQQLPTHSSSNRPAPGSARNRRLTEQFERKHGNLAALRPSQRSVQQRLGRLSMEENLLKPLSQRLGIRRGRGGRGRGGGRLARAALLTEDITWVRGRGRRRGRGGRGGLQRSASVQSLQRTASMQSLTGIGRQSRPRSRSRPRMRMDRSLSRGSIGGRSRSRSRSRNMGDTGAIRGRSRSRTRGGAQARRARSRGRAPLNQRGGGIGKRGRSNSRTRNPINTRGGRGGGRGARRGGRRGQGRRGGSTGLPPSREELDKQLDQYMAKSKNDNDPIIKLDDSWA